MAITTDEIKWVYTGNDSADTFAYENKIYASSDLRVTEIVDATGVATVLTLTTDYTVTDVGSSTGGDVVLTAGNLATGKTLVIQILLPLTQETTFEEGDKFLHVVMENALDRLTLQNQAQEEAIGRAIKADITTEDTELTLPAPSEDKALKWTATGGLKNSTYDPDEQVTLATAQAVTATTQASNASTSASAAQTAQGLAEDARDLAQGYAESIDPDNFLNKTDDKATQAQAEAGTDDATYMTPLKTVQSIAAKGEQVAVFTDTKAQNTNGGTFTQADWRRRDIVTTQHNGITGCSLGSSQITLPAGTYFVEAFASAYQVNANILRFYNTTDSSVTVSGINNFAGAVETVVTKASLCGVFTIAGTKVFELQHYCTTTKADTGFGAALNIQAEIYSEIKLEKIA